LNYSVIIAERNEPDLKATVANIKENSEAHVIVMSDAKGLGPQAMRHKGIELAAGSEVCIVMDGHMRIKPRALDAMAEWCRRKPSSVAVAECYHHYEETWTGQPYSGARFAWKDFGKDASEPQAFVAKWRKDHSVGQIPCVMGACYGFSRGWYMDGIRAPWAFGTGWGCDEEILSAATWLRGGTVDLLPAQVWHRARKPGQVPYELSRRELLGVWANRMRILDMLPMSNEEKQELVLHIAPALHINDWRQVNEINKIFADSVEAFREFLSTGPLKWAKFKEMIGMETVKEMGMKDLRQVAADRGITVPFGCKKADLYTMLQADTGFEVKPIIVQKLAEKPKAPIANWGPLEKNNRGTRCCAHCGGSHTVVVTTNTTHRLTTRYRKCSDCSKRFPTREIIATL
jgi:hypothetical protein